MGHPHVQINPPAVFFFFFFFKCHFALGPERYLHPMHGSQDQLVTFSYSAHGRNIGIYIPAQYEASAAQIILCGRPEVAASPFCGELLHLNHP